MQKGVPRPKVCEEGTGSEGMVLCVRWAVLQEGLEIGSRGSEGVTSPLSPRPPAPPQLLQTKSLLGP